MARKKSAEKPEMVKAEPEMKAVRLELPAPVHRKFKIVAAQADTNMSHLARKLVEEYVAREYREAK